MIPEALRHQALALRAEWMTRLAADAEHSVPAYVREVEVVIGPAALAARLDGTAQPVELGSSSDAMFAARMDALAERERDLSRRERLMRTREERELAPSRAVDDRELEEVDDDSALAYERAVVRAELELGADETAAEEGEFENVEAGSEEENLIEDADNQVEEVEDIEAESVASAEEDGSYDDNLGSSSGERAVAALLIDDGAGFGADTLEGLASPPESFVNDPEMQLFLSAIAGQVWLFVRGRPPVMREGAEIDLLLQIDPDADVLVPLVTFVFDTAGSPKCVVVWSTGRSRTA